MGLRIKVCGITTATDAALAVTAGADALGFVFYPSSCRAVSVEQAAGIVATLPPFVTTVGLFVNADPVYVQGVMVATGLDVVQLHGDEPPSMVTAVAPYRVIKALPSATPLERWQSYQGAAAWLVDAAVPGCYGGTGQLADWQYVADLAAQSRVILAGGLTPDNVALAVAKVRPYAVDVASGVEAAPGRKDKAKLRQFVTAARSGESGGPS